MKLVNCLICSVAWLLADAAVADPIANSVVGGYKASWFDATGKTCPEICRPRHMAAESEKNTAPPAKRSYVCKIRKAEHGPYSWLFGTQFDERPVCYVTDRDLKGEYRKTFYCLCVR